tara:strand:+ start:581 stop:712 length:132 start_codon:yes stop_codon:yes gene_type:complete
VQKRAKKSKIGAKTNHLTFEEWLKWRANHFKENNKDWKSKKDN